MATLIEGTLEEVREHLNGLSLPAEMRLQVTITQEAEAMREERELRAALERKYANVPHRLGIPQISFPKSLTVEEIKELSED